MGKLLRWFIKWKAMKKVYEKGRSDGRKTRRR
jgi:hypothetical protein